jgi:hypothetical protein
LSGPNWPHPVRIPPKIKSVSAISRVLWRYELTCRILVPSTTCALSPARPCRVSCTVTLLNVHGYPSHRAHLYHVRPYHDESAGKSSELHRGGMCCSYENMEYKSECPRGTIVSSSTQALHINNLPLTKHLHHSTRLISLHHKIPKQTSTS